VLTQTGGDIPLIWTKGEDHGTLNNILPDVNTAISVTTSSAGNLDSHGETQNRQCLLCWHRKFKD